MADAFWPLFGATFEKKDVERGGRKKHPEPNLEQPKIGASGGPPNDDVTQNRKT